MVTVCYTSLIFCFMMLIIFLILQVSDFGLAKDDTIDQVDSDKFPIKWTAPEAIQQKVSHRTPVHFFLLKLTKLLYINSF